MGVVGSDELDERPFRDWLTIQFVTAVLLLPWIVTIFQRTVSVSSGDESGVTWIPEPTLASLAGTVGHHVFHGGSTALLLLGLGGASWAIVHGLRANREKKDVATVLSAWYLCVTLLPFAISYIITPMFKTRYTIAAVPPIVLLVSSGIGTLGRRIDDSLIRWVLIVVLVAALLLPLGSYYGKDQNAQWREAGEHVDEYVKQDGLVLVTKSYTARNLRYYVEREDITVQGIESAAEIEDLERHVADRDTVWVVTSNLDGRERVAFLERVNRTALSPSAGSESSRLVGQLSPWRGRRNASFVDVTVYRFGRDKPDE